MDEYLVTEINFNGNKPLCCTKYIRNFKVQQLYQSAEQVWSREQMIEELINNGTTVYFSVEGSHKTLDYDDELNRFPISIVSLPTFNV
jgi:hypothetical protein